jgi:hypothetical protein
MILGTVHSTEFPGIAAGDANTGVKYQTLHIFHMVRLLFHTFVQESANAEVVPLTLTSAWSGYVPGIWSIPRTAAFITSSVPCEKLL